MSKNEETRFGIGEWYGKLFICLSPEDRKTLAQIKDVKKLTCPFRLDLGMCNKRGGVCSMALYRKTDDGDVMLDIQTTGLVTLCPNRFWQDNLVFREIGLRLLDTSTPTLIKEVNFLRMIDYKGEVKKKFVGKIDLILTKDSNHEGIDDWCALEFQAVYFSGKSMNSEFKAIYDNSDRLLFPTQIRRPDFRSSGPKRLMPQLEIKVPTLRRWGKKMVVVVDKPFFESIAPMRRVESLTNADIAWFIVDYDKTNSSILIDTCLRKSSLIFFLRPILNL